MLGAGRDWKGNSSSTFTLVELWAHVTALGFSSIARAKIAGIIATMDQKDTPATPADIDRVRQSAQVFARYCQWLARELRRPTLHRAVADAAAEALDLVSAQADKAPV